MALTLVLAPGLLSWPVRPASESRPLKHARRGRISPAPGDGHGGRGGRVTDLNVRDTYIGGSKHAPIAAAHRPVVPRGALPPPCPRPTIRHPCASPPPRRPHWPSPPPPG